MVHTKLNDILKEKLKARHAQVQLTEHEKTEIMDYLTREFVENENQTATFLLGDYFGLISTKDLFKVKPAQVRALTDYLLEEGFGVNVKYHDFMNKIRSIVVCLSMHTKEVYGLESDFFN